MFIRKKIRNLDFENSPSYLKLVKTIKVSQFLVL